MKIQISNYESRMMPANRPGASANSSFEIRHSKLAGGFTLIELILAVGIAAIVLISINAVFFGALRLRDATTEAVDQAAPLELTFSTMRRDFECAVPPNPNGGFGIDFKTGNVVSIGLTDPVSAELYTATGALHENEPWGDIQRITYGLRSVPSAAGPGKALIRSVTRNLLSDTSPEVDEQPLLTGVESIEFDCYDGSQWQTEWDTTSTTSLNTNLPTGVRVVIQMAAKGSTRPQPCVLVVPIDSQSRTNTSS